MIIKSIYKQASKRKQKLNPQIPWAIRFRLLTVENSANLWVWKTTVVFIMVIAALLFLRIGVLLLRLDIFQDPGFAGLFGALFGALLGGVIGGGISYFIQIRQQKSNAAIKRKEEIYEPFLKSLVEVQNIFDIQDFPSKTLLEFSSWEELLRYSQAIELPLWLRSQLKTFTEELTKYIQLRDVAYAACLAHLFAFARGHKLVFEEIAETQENLLSAIISKNHESPSLRIKEGNYFMRPTQELERIRDIAFQECGQISEFQELQELLLNVIKPKFSWFVFTTKQLIYYITVVYEEEGGLFDRV